MKRHLLDVLPPHDVFLHLWEMVDVQANLTTASKFKWRNDGCTTAHVIEHLKPIAHIITPYSDDWQHKIMVEALGNDYSHVLNKMTRVESGYAINAASMYYKIQKCFQLAQVYALHHGFGYDLVIRARLDFLWLEPIDLMRVVDLTKSNNAYLLKDRYATISKLPTNDKFFAGNQAVMTKLCRTFANLKLYHELGCRIEGQAIHEYAIKHHGLDVVWFGHMYMFYKCMGYHVNIKGRRLVLVRYAASYDLLITELCYQLMYNYGCRVIMLIEDGGNKSDVEMSAGLQLLQLFESFGIVSDDSFIDHVHWRLRFDATTHLMLYLTLHYDTSCLIVSPSIPQANVIDFIISMIINNATTSYHFTSTKIVNASVGEIINFWFLDHGIHRTVMLDNDTVMMHNKKHKAHRHLYKIINLEAHVTDGHVMPCNQVKIESTN
ncbi:Hypothetical protein MVR_LOCUS94 [uncultured virus]|nr:Hypothetical protein MVR_LOCUS94 [uncultured virus]